MGNTFPPQDSPGGTNGQLQYNNAGTLSGVTISGDGTLNTSTGSLIITKTNGINFATSATTNACNASNITSGNLPTAQLPSLTSANVWIGSGANIAIAVSISGDATLSNSGGLVVTKTNGVAFATSATTDTTNASNITSGTLPLAQLSGITTTQMDPTALQMIQVNLSSADIKSLNSSPKTIINAPGAGKIIVPVNMMISYTYGTAAYTSGGNLFFEWNTAACTSAANSSVFTTAASTVAQFVPTNTTATQTAAGNQALRLTNQTANFATGDGTAVVTVWYRVLTL